MSKPIVSRVMPRWQRKALRHKNAQAAHAATEAAAAASKTPRKTTGGTPRKVGTRTPGKGPKTPGKGCRTPTGKGKRTPGSKTPRADRFIPNRSAMDFDISHYNLAAAGDSHASGEAECGEGDVSPASRRLKSALASSMLPNSDAHSASSATATEAGATLHAHGGAGGATPHRVLAFRDKAPAPREGHTNSLKVLYSQNAIKGDSQPGHVHRHIASAPERVLDAPGILDDYYLNTLDWGVSNKLAVALGPTVYLWDAVTGGIQELLTLENEEDYVSSVSFIKEGGGYLAVGTSDSCVQLWDVEKARQVRSMRGHAARVSSLDWNRHVLSSGSRDSSIHNHDVRVRDHHIATLAGHDQEVCGLKWSPDGSYLASGGNDNLLCIWDAASSSTSASSPIAPKHVLRDHNAAVKALAWCPFQRNVLASGGGTADRCIKFWNAANGSMLNSIDTGSQVCSLVWSQHEKELLSSHGYSQNQLCLWKYPSMAKVKELESHTARVLHLAAGPDGATVCSAAADETLRFWNVFGAPKKSGASKKGSRLLRASRSIR